MPETQNNDQRMPGGRPTTYQRDYCERLIAHMREGKSAAAFCAEVGVHRDTFNAWCKTHEEFSDAYKIGQECSLAWWEELGRKHATYVSGPEHRLLHPALYAIQMHNRFGWRHRSDVKQETSGELKLSGEAPLFVVNAAPPAELVKAAQAAQAAQANKPG